MDHTDDRRVLRLPAADIRPNPAQPRRFFDESSLRELAASLADHERAVILYCLYYDNFGFRYYHGTTYEEMLACVDEAHAAGVELWQADFTITPESVALTDYHPLEEW